MNFPKNASKQQKSIVFLYVILFREKKVFVNFAPYYLFDQKQLFKQIQIFLWICPFSIMVRKTNFLSISMLVSEIVIFWLKREVLCEFPQKWLKKKKHSFVVCELILEEIFFLLIFVHFYWFNQKKLFEYIQIFFRICPFSNMVRKTNFMSISVTISEIITFKSKKKSSLWIST